MEELRFVVPTLFGLEGIAADEFRRLGFAGVQAADGRVTFTGDAGTLAKANLWSRYGERILLELGRFRALTFDQLFEGVKAIPWERYLPRDAEFPVDGYSLRSVLASVPDCQKIIKKAVVTRMQKTYPVARFAETGDRYRVRFSLMHDEACVCLDTSGDPLHKRGYRPAANLAPLRETLAAAMVDLARWRGRGEFLDPFCGSGTIAIEAALKAANRAPGLGRRFDAERWTFLPGNVFSLAREEARDSIRPVESLVMGRDIDDTALEIARANAKRAGVGGLIRFSHADAQTTSLAGFTGTVVTNPPYGERMGDLRQARDICVRFGKQMCAAPEAKLYLITADEEFEKFFGRRADKKRKLYNGMIRCSLYMYFKTTEAGRKA